MLSSWRSRRRARDVNHPRLDEEDTMSITRAVSVVVVTALLFVAGAVSAQTPGAPAAPAAPAAPPPDYGASITNEQAKKVMAGAEAEAKKNKWNVVIYILDSGGQPVMMQRLDGAQWGSVEIARKKAESSVALRRPTKALQDAVAQGGANLRLLTIGYSVLEGGIPIVVGGKIVGGIGVSGVTSQQDAQIAQAGIDALK
jgi:glc operon protein GlcG